MAEMNTLERLASGKTVIHRLPPIVKFFATLVYLVAVISFNRYEILGLMPFFFYPAILMALSETPYRPLLKRLVFALPFVLLAGLANLIYDRETAFFLAGTAVSYGLLSFLSVVLKAALSVMAVLILVSTTSLRDLSKALRKAKVPSLFVDLLVLSYRYLSVLLAEAGTMYTAYLLRSPAAKGIRLQHIGSFIGQLLLRSIDRAERVYFAMKCRGFGSGQKDTKENSRKFEEKNDNGETRMIEVKELTLAYPDGTVGIRNADFVIKAGETVALIGANGAGKSTLLLGLVGILPRISGELYLNEKPVADKDFAGLRRAVAMVFQNPDDQLFMPSIKDDLAFGPSNYGMAEEETTEKVQEVLRLLGIEMLAEKMPHKLSGGEKRLAAIGTVLVMEPELILLDEPSSFLDPKARRNLISVLSKIPQAKLIATHDLDFAMDLCERVIILKNGEILADGSAKAILYDKELLECAGLELPLGLSERIEKKSDREKTDSLPSKFLLGDS